MPRISSLGDGSAGGFGRGGKKGAVVLTGTYYNGDSTIPTSLTASRGAAKVVFNGYGILFYGWQSSSTANSMYLVTLPSDLVGSLVDITFIGGGGYHNGGGGGGGAGAGGGRHLIMLSSNSFYIKTGTHIYSSSYWNSSTTGIDEWRNTRIWMNGGTDQLYGPHASETTGSTATGGNVYNYKGPDSGTASSLANSNSTNLTYIQARDSTFQYCYAGAGQYLYGFSVGYPNGSDLGGGGGAQDYANYGGSSASGSAGRYGYVGGLRDGNGGGPVGGRRAGVGTYRKGAGGSFGAGVGDAGNNDSEPTTPGGGAILLRWDTTLATFQTGTPGWP